MDDLRAATVADPTLVLAWTSLGLAYEFLPGLLGGSTRKALRCAERLRAIAPARGDLLQALILVEESKWREAESWFGRALAKAPQDPEVVGQWLDALDRKPAKQTLGEAGKNARQWPAPSRGPAGPGSGPARTPRRRLLRLPRRLVAQGTDPSRPRPKG